MTSPEANEHSDQTDERNLATRELSGADKPEELELEQLEAISQSDEPLIDRPSSNEVWRVDHTELDVLLVASPGFADSDYH